MKNYFLLTFFFSLIFFVSCKNRDIACTEEFRMVTIKINGEDKLDYFYTVRVSTEDTLWHNLNQQSLDGRYVVLDDNYHKYLKNQIDTFIFYGYIYKGKDDLLIQEKFVIEADDCHINYVSGDWEVDL